MSETLFLHGLADDLGVEAADLRHSVLLAVSQAADRPTRDTRGLFVLKSNTSTPANDFILPKGTSETIVFVQDQEGMFPMAGPRKSTNGIGIVVSGQGDDDDVYCLVEITGLLPDGEVWEERYSSGKHVIEFPKLISASAKIEVTFTNPTDNTTGTDFNIGTTAWMLRAKSRVTDAGRRQLAERIGSDKVGGAKGALFGTVGEMIEKSFGVRDRIKNQAAAMLHGGDRPGASKALSGMASAVKGGIASAVSNGTLANKAFGKAMLEQGSEVISNAREKIGAFLGR